jgi:hypothetical protein
VTEPAVFVTIAVALVCWAAAEWCRAAGLADQARFAWTAGALAMIVHSAAAFALFYGWNQAAALAATAAQTAALTGLDWSGGLYVNYAFVALWTADSMWWWLSPAGYLRRPATLDWSIRFFFYFMMLNGAVVFADVWMRVLGMLAIGVVTIAWLMKRYKPAVF